MSASPFILAVCAEMLFLDLPVADRVRRIHDAGFAVEIWDWRNHDLDLLEALAASGVALHVDDRLRRRGALADPDGADELLAHRRRVRRGVAPARHPEPQPARHRPRRRGLPVVPGRRR